MANSVFVCYHHGCKGEYLSHKISQQKGMRRLVADKINGRTIIKNDYFDKNFLSLHKNLTDIVTKPLPGTGGNVSPSHYFYDDLHRHYPEAKYISIDAPIDQTKFKHELESRFLQYQTDNIQELIGECRDKFKTNNVGATDREVKSFIQSIMKIKNVTFGDIMCLSRGMEPTLENKHSVLESLVPAPLSEMTKQKSLVVAYEDVVHTDMSFIMSYINK